jgi:hypothetical protein
VAQLDYRNGVPAEFPRGQQPSMAGYYVLPVVDQDWDVKPKCLDTLSDLAYLLVFMDSRVLWVGMLSRGK